MSSLAGENLFSQTFAVIINITTQVASCQPEKAPTLATFSKETNVIHKKKHKQNIEKIGN